MTTQWQRPSNWAGAMLFAAIFVALPLLADEPTTAPSDNSAEIRPFHYTAPESALVDLRQRILATRWPDPELVPDASQGVQLATMQKLARYWATDYDWRRCEAKLNSLPEFVTTIDGVDIQFIHVRSKEKNALPIIITHGWPGSIIEQLKIIGPLTNPTAYGGKAEDAFDVVIPSIPGYGFSGKLVVPGSHREGTNPEQLFAAGWSACFTSAILHAALKRKVALPPGTAVDAEVDLCKEADGTHVLQARLNISLPGLEQEVAESIVNTAHQLCPYSKVTRGKINLVINLV